MTTAEQVRAVMTRPAQTIVIAGVPWPAYKIVALVIGLVTFVAVGAVTASAATAVLSATAVSVSAWLSLAAAGRSR